MGILAGTSQTVQNEDAIAQATRTSLFVHRGDIDTNEDDIPVGMRQDVQMQPLKQKSTRENEAIHGGVTHAHAGQQPVETGSGTNLDAAGEDEWPAGGSRS